MSITPSQAFGRRMSEARKTMSPAMSQKALAERLTELDPATAGTPRRFRMSRPTVSEIERGDKEVSLEEVFAIAYVLDVSPLHLLVPFEESEAATVEVIPGVELHTQEARGWITGESAPRWFRADDYIEGAKRRVRFYVDEVPLRLRQSRKEDARDHREWKRNGGEAKAQERWEREAAKAEAEGRRVPMDSRLARPEWLSDLMTIAPDTEETR